MNQWSCHIFKINFLVNRGNRIAIVALVLNTIIVCEWSLASPGNAEENLQLIQSATPRNTNHDLSAWRDVPQASLNIENHLGNREDYLGREYLYGIIAGNKEHAFPDEGGGQFRITCEFSHFAYDDPLIYSGKPGASHLHMFWGNTDVNAFSSYDSLINSGSSTCNGQEINRSAYWIPAMFDANGNVRVPMRIIVYYKGYGLAKGRSEVYPPNAAIIATENLHTVPDSQGGAQFEAAFQCSDQFRSNRSPQANTIPVCEGDRYFLDTLEVHVKFPNCWNRKDPSDPDNWSTSLAGGWYWSECLDGVTTPNIEYIVQYPLTEGETTEGWYLSSDVDPQSRLVSSTPGATLHGDWWGAWHPEVNQMWLDGCVNIENGNVPSGCGMGYLSDGGPDPEKPWPGPALKLRPQYDFAFDIYGNSTGQSEYATSAIELYRQLCPHGPEIETAAEAAWCTPMGAGHVHNGHEDDNDTNLDSDEHQPEKPTRGLRARYFDNPWFGTAVGERVDRTINFPDADTFLPGSGLTEDTTFSVEWQGYLMSDKTETVNIWTVSDDGVRVYLDGKLIIDNWTDHAATRNIATVQLVANTAQSIAVQYYQRRGKARMRLGWTRSNGKSRVIAPRFLHPDYPAQL